MSLEGVADTVASSQLSIAEQDDPPESTRSELLEHFRITRDDAASESPKQFRETWSKEKELGHGSFGNVYLERSSLGKTRAIKEVRKRDGINFNHELEALTRLSRPAYLDYFGQFLGWYEDDTLITFAMEYFPLGDLRQCLKTNTLSEEEARDITGQLLSGLAVMHEDGFVHRDLKPENIFVVLVYPRWKIKIGDFGVSKRFHNDTILQTQVGTVLYMAPEVLGFVASTSGSLAYTTAVDIWAVGIVLYEVLTGRRPFRTTNDLNALCAGKLSFSRSTLRNCNASMLVDAILKLLLRPKPKNRPSARDALRHAWFAAATDVAVPLQFTDNFTLLDNGTSLTVSRMERETGAMSLLFTDQSTASGEDVKSPPPTVDGVFSPTQFRQSQKTVDSGFSEGTLASIRPARLVEEPSSATFNPSNLGVLADTRQHYQKLASSSGTLNPGTSAHDKDSTSQPLASTVFSPKRTSTNSVLPRSVTAVATRKSMTTTAVKKPAASQSSSPTVNHIPPRSAASSSITMTPAHREAHTYKARISSSRYFAISLDGRQLASADADGTLVLRNCDSALQEPSPDDQILYTPNGTGLCEVRGVCFSPDSRLLCSVHEWGPPQENSRKRLTDHMSAVHVFHVQSAMECHNMVTRGEVTARFSQSGQILAVATPTEVKLLNTSNWNTFQTIKLSETRRIAISPDDKILVTSSTWWLMRAFSIASGEKLREIEETRIVGFRPDGLVLVYDKESHFLSLCESETWTEKRYWDHDLISGSYFCYSDDGRVVAYKKGIQITVVDPETGDVMPAISARNSLYYAMSYDGRYLAAMFKDRTVKVWEINLVQLFGKSTLSTPAGSNSAA